jgi:hypothetical protein
MSWSLCGHCVVTSVSQNCVVNIYKKQSNQSNLPIRNSHILWYQISVNPLRATTMVSCGRVFFVKQGKGLHQTMMLDHWNSLDIRAQSTVPRNDETDYNNWNVTVLDR